MRYCLAALRNIAGFEGLDDAGDIPHDGHTFTKDAHSADTHAAATAQGSTGAAWWMREAAEPLATGSPSFAIVLDFAHVDVVRTPIPGLDRLVLHSKWNVKNHVLLTVPSVDAVRAVGDDKIPSAWATGSKLRKIPHHEECARWRKLRLRGRAASVVAGVGDTTAPHGTATITGSLLAAQRPHTAGPSAARGAGSPLLEAAATNPSSARSPSSATPTLPASAAGPACGGAAPNAEPGASILDAIPRARHDVGDITGGSILTTDTAVPASTVCGRGAGGKRGVARDDPSVAADAHAPSASTPPGHAGAALGGAHSRHAAGAAGDGDASDGCAPKEGGDAPPPSHVLPPPLPPMDADVPCDACSRTLAIHCAVPRELERLFVRIRAGALLRGRLDLHDAAVKAPAPTAAPAVAAIAAGGGYADGNPVYADACGARRASSVPPTVVDAVVVDAVAPSAPVAPPPTRSAAPASPPGPRPDGERPISPTGSSARRAATGPLASTTPTTWEAVVGGAVGVAAVEDPPATGGPVSPLDPSRVAGDEAWVLSPTALGVLLPSSPQAMDLKGAGPEAVAAAAATAATAARTGSDGDGTGQLAGVAQHEGGRDRGARAPLVLPGTGGATQLAADRGAKGADAAAAAAGQAAAAVPATKTTPSAGTQPVPPHSPTPHSFPPGVAPPAFRGAGAATSACAQRAAAQVSSWADYLANGPLRPEARRVLWGDPTVRVCGCVQPRHAPVSTPWAGDQSSCAPSLSGSVITSPLGGGGSVGMNGSFSDAFGHTAASGAAATSADSGARGGSAPAHPHPPQPLCVRAPARGEVAFSFCQQCGFLAPPGAYAAETLRAIDPYLHASAAFGAPDASIAWFPQFVAAVAASSVGGSGGLSAHPAAVGFGPTSPLYSRPPLPIDTRPMAARSGSGASVAPVGAAGGAPARIRALTPPSRPPPTHPHAGTDGLRGAHAASVSSITSGGGGGPGTSLAGGSVDSVKSGGGSREKRSRTILGAIDTWLHKHVASSGPADSASASGAGGASGAAADGPLPSVDIAAQLESSYGVGVGRSSTRTGPSGPQGTAASTAAQGAVASGGGGISGCGPLPPFDAGPAFHGGASGGREEAPAFLRQSGAAALAAVNVLVTRLLWDFWRDPNLTEFMQDEINLKLSLLPKVLGLIVPTVRCVALNLGGCVPHVTQIGWPYIGPDGTIGVELAASWAGGATLALAVSLSAPGFSAQVAIGVVVRVGALAAQLRIEASPPPAREFWAGFLSPPTLDIEAEVEAGSVGDRLLKRFPTLIDVLIAKIKDRLLVSMVLPQYEDFPIPKFPERKRTATPHDPSSSESEDDEVAQLVAHLRGHPED